MTLDEFAELLKGRGVPTEPEEEDTTDDYETQCFLRLGCDDDQQ